MRCNIYEVMEYGSIVFSNVEYGVLITVNGAYFNWWNRVYDWASGFGRTNDRVSDGIVPGAIAGKFYIPGYQEIGLSGLSN